MTVYEKNLKESKDFAVHNGLSSTNTGFRFQDIETGSGDDFAPEFISDTIHIMQQSDEWDELAASFSTPLLASDWFISGAKAFCPPNKLTTFALKSGGKFNAIAPLCLKGNFLSNLEFVGSSTLREPGGLLYESHKSLKALIQIILDANKSLFLKRLYKSSPEVSLLKRELKTRSFIHETHEERIPYLNTTGDWKVFEKEQISSSRRSSFRRLHRKAGEKGGVRFEVIVPNKENLDEYLREVYRIEAANWKGRMGSAMKTHSSLNKFFRYYSECTVKEEKLHLFFLKIGEETVAVQLTVVHSNRLWIYKIGYNEEWSWCSPGILLMHNVVHFCFESNLEGCEFLGYDEPWLHIWANDFHDLVSFRIYPRSGLGRLVRLWDHLRTFYYKKRYGKRLR